MTRPVQVLAGIAVLAIVATTALLAKPFAEGSASTGDGLKSSKAQTAVSGAKSAGKQVAKRRKASRRQEAVATNNVVENTYF